MSEKQNPIVQIGVVVIGRNEGERLRRCLESVVWHTRKVLYVDSGSTDGSVDIARSLGVVVIELDMAVPFTAARARNEGFRRLREVAPDLGYVQFVDGDCEVVPGWLGKAVLFLDEHADVAVVCGRRRERFPDRSVYNMLCDIEWNTPVGEAKDCGGDAMVRAVALEQVKGYRDDVIAGEDSELCLRLLAADWNIWRLDAEMTLHDAAMLRFGQWWKRTVRGGHAFAERAYLHGASPERHCVRETLSAWVFGGILPLASLAAMYAWGALGFALLAIYPLQVVRLAQRGRRSTRENWWWAFFLVLGKFPEMLGQLRFWWNRFSNRTNTLIEYK